MLETNCTLYFLVLQRQQAFKNQIILRWTSCKPLPKMLLVRKTIRPVQKSTSVNNQTKYQELKTCFVPWVKVCSLCCKMLHIIILSVKIGLKVVEKIINGLFIITGSNGKILSSFLHPGFTFQQPRFNINPKIVNFMCWAAAAVLGVKGFEMFWNYSPLFYRTWNKQQ